MAKTFKSKPKVLGLDISTKTIGWALFDMTGKELLELTHFTPVIKPKCEDKLEEMIKKVSLFEEKLLNYTDMGITKVIIEEPLLNSNNVFTVGTLLRYNSMITKAVYDTIGVIPTFISTYNSRKYAFPELMSENDKGRTVLFGGYPKDIDKKMVVWEMVAKREPQIVWQYTRNNTLKKENFDQADAYACVLGYMNMEGLW